MKTFFNGRRRLATVSLAAAIALTGFVGLRAATTGHLFGDNPSRARAVAEQVTLCCPDQSPFGRPLEIRSLN